MNLKNLSNHLSIFAIMLFILTAPTLNAQLAPLGSMRGLEVGLESNFAREKSPRILFGTFSTHILWGHVPLSKGFGFYADIPFSIVSVPNEVLFDNKDQTVLLNSMIAGTWQNKNERWQLGFGIRFPTSISTNVNTFTGFFVYNTHPELFLETTSIQFWTQKRGIKPFLTYFTFEFLAGWRFFSNPDIGDDFAIQIQPQLNFNHQYFSIETNFDSSFFLSGGQNLADDENRILVYSLGAAANGFKARPYIRWVHNFDELTQDFVQDLVRMGVKYSF